MIAESYPLLIQASQSTHSLNLLGLLFLWPIILGDELMDRDIGAFFRFKGGHHPSAALGRLSLPIGHIKRQALGCHRAVWLSGTGQQGNLVVMPVDRQGDIRRSQGRQTIEQVLRRDGVTLEVECVEYIVRMS